MTLLPKAIVCALMLLPSGPAFQTQQSSGYLHVTSDPPGVTIVINNKSTGAKTNATVVVTPGTYTVTATSGSKNLSCQPAPVQVNSGETKQVHCG